MNKQTCTIKSPDQLQSVGAAIREMLAEGKPVRIQFKQAESDRSLSQNRLLWKWHGELKEHLLQHTGDIFSSEDIHAWVVTKLLPQKPVMINNEVVIKRAETSKIGMKEFSIFLERYEMFVAETYSLNFTRPDELYWSAMGAAK